MGRFFRRLFHLAFPAAAGCSALALVACLILWPLSYRYVMDLGYATSGGSAFALGGGRGQVWARYGSVPWMPPGFSYDFVPYDPILVDWSYTDWRHEESPESSSTCDRALGCEWSRNAVLSFLALPLLYPTLLSAMLPAFWLRGFVRRRRQARRRGFPVEPVA